MTIYDAANAEIVSAAAVSVVASVAQYTITAATTASLDTEEGWRVEWSLVMPDGVTHVFRVEAALVLRRLYPTITDLDIFRRESGLDPSGADPITTLSDYQDYIDEADEDVQLHLIERGNRPNLITSPSALHLIWLFTALHLIFRDLSTRLNPTYADRAREYGEDLARAWASASFLYDDDDDGQANSTNRRAAQPSIWLCGRD